MEERAKVENKDDETDHEFVLGTGFAGTGFKFNPKPQIIDDVQEFLKNKGHTCAMYNMSEEKLSWCQKDECQDVKIRNNMKKRQKKQEDFSADLLAKGHNCIVYLELYPMQIRWCKQEVCTTPSPADEGG